MRAPSPWRTPAVTLALLSILALAAAFRATNLRWDEDLALHPDERFLTMVMTSITIPEPCRGFIPHWKWPEGVPMPEFQRDLPGCISAYLDSATSPMNPRNVGHSLWVYGSLPITVLRIATEVLDIRDFYEVTRAGRVLSVLTELATIVLSFFLGKRLLDWRLGLLGAFLLSLSVLNIQNAHFFTVDTMTTLAVLLCVYLAVVIAEGKGSWGIFALLGLAFGAALSCKINVASFALIIVLAGGVRLWRAIWAGEERPYPWSILSATASVGLSALAMFIVVAGILVFLVTTSQSTWNFPLVAFGLLLSAGLAVLLWWLRHAHLQRQRPAFWPALLETSVGLLLAAILAIGVFRLAQPDAFLAPGAQPQGGGMGVLGPAEGLARQIFDVRFLENMATVQGLVSGEVDYYPSHQWTNRTALLFPWQNMVIWGMGLPLGLTAWAGVVLASWRFFAKRETRFLVPLSWTVFFFVYQGVQFVKTMRYFLPLYPLLCLFAGYLLLTAWDWARRRKPTPAPGGPVSLKPAARLPWRTILAGLLLGLVILGTFLWAWAFIQIYRKPVTRAVASRWIYKNIPTEWGAFLHLSDGTQVAIAIPNAQEYGPAYPPSITPFTLADGGMVTAVTIAHLQDTRDSPDEERLEVAIAADRDGQQLLARGEIVGNFTGPAGDAAPGTATLDPLPLAAGRTYYLRLQGRQGFLRTWAVALANETWDDPVPMRVDGKDGFAPTAGGYRGLMLQPYAEDTPQKVDELLHQLANTDYVCLTSNRLYDSIPRLPMRYPATTRYYQALFDGSLGFERVATFTSYPTLLALGVPEGIADKSDEERAALDSGWAGLPIPDQGAEEAFSVYDHPKVQIFRRTAAFDIEKARALLTDGIDWDSIARIRPIEVPAYRDLMLTPQEQQVQQQGGTWSEIFPPSGWPTKVALPLWLLVVEVLGLAVLPLAQVLLGRLADGGYLPAKALGLLLLGYLSWLLAASKVLPYTRWTILGLLFFLLLLGLGVGWLRRKELLALWQTRRRLLLLEEGLFLFGFLVFLLIRMGNPDLWHPWFGGEKPMDLAYLTAVVRSTTFPPYDPWFSGGYLNYYYFGQILIGTLVKLTGIEIAVAYNLALPLLFGLTCGGAFTVVYHLVWREERTHGWDRRAIVCGLAGVLFLAFLGNIGEFFLLVTKMAEVGGRVLANAGLSFDSSIPGLAPLVKALIGLPDTLRDGLPIGLGSWYWDPSRIILRGEINEFPFFTFLYADLHAHMYALPYTLLALTSIVSLIKDRERRGDFLWGLLPPPWIVLGLGLVLGCLRAAHQWDLPTYLIVVAAGWGVALYERWRGNWRTFVGTFVLGGTLLLLSGLLYQPFWARYGSYYNQLLPWTGERTHVWEYAAINGLSLFILVSYLLSESFGAGAREKPLHLVGLWIRYWDRLPALLRRLRRWEGLGKPAGRTPPARTVLFVGALVTGLLVLLFFLPPAPTGDLPPDTFSLQRLPGQHLIGVLLPLIVLATVLFFRRQRGETRFVVGLILLGLGISVGVELVTVRGDIGRMNTFFRFYLQLWILWAIAAAAALPRLWQRSRRWSTVACRVWRGALFLLIALCALYPLLATPAKVQDRFPNNSQGPGLDGEAFMRTEVLPEEHGPVVLAEDYGAILWLRKNVVGTPVILEASLGTGYRNFGSRISVYTGLPTILGWDWHQTQQRALVSEQVHHSVVQPRLADVSTLYNTTDIETTVALLRKYRVSYIVVGQLERYYYQSEGLAKFERMVGTYLERVYPQAGAAAPAGGTTALDPTPYPNPTAAVQGPAAYPTPATSSTAYPATPEEELPHPAPAPGRGTIIYRVLPAVWRP